LSAGFLYWALKGVDAAAVMRQLRFANPWLFALSVAVVTLTFPARAVRWRLLLGASTGRPEPLGPVWHATAIGFMANNILPARAGELARAYAGHRLVGLPTSTAFSTIALERVFDGVVVMTLLALGIAAPEFPRDVRLGSWTISGLAAAASAVFGGALVVLAAAANRPGPAVGLADRIIHRVLPRRAATMVSRLAHNLFDGLSALRSSHAFARVLTWSFVVWLVNAASFALAFAAFRLESLPLTAALVLQGITVLGVAIPSSPGYVGLFEAACVVSLGIYGIGRDHAVGFAIALHLAWFVPITVLGLWSLVRAGLTLGDLGTRRREA
jgi:hypothetical protein